MSDIETSLARFRADFPILDQKVHGKPLIYFDNAATTQKPTRVIDALVQYYQRDNSNVHRGIHELSSRATIAYEQARIRVARFIKAPNSNEIIFTRGTTESINLVASSWGVANLKPGDTILLTEMEHHSNIVPWQLVAARTGARLEYVPVTGDDGLLDLPRLWELLEQRPRIFAFTHISNTLGTVNPVSEICERARKLGVVTLVDAAQSAGHRSLNVAELKCDFLALSGHKLCGPTGIGALYARAEHLEKMPPYMGGGDMISSVDFFASSWKEIPHKFEAGTPDISGAIGMAAALDYLETVGMDRITAHDHELAGYAYEQLATLDNIRLFGPRSDRAGLVSFMLKDIHAHDVVTIADQHGLALRGGHHCNQPLMRKLGVDSTARASFYFYNTRSEVDRMVEIIKDIQKFFAV